MDLRITARHFVLDDDTKDYVEKQITSVTKFIDRIIDAQLTLTYNGHHVYNLEFSVILSGKTLIAKTESHELKLGIDKVSNKMERLIKDYHDKLIGTKSHRNEEEKRNFLNEISRNLNEE